MTLVLVYLASRWIYWALGVHFSVGELSVALQFLDPELLRSHLLDSLWHLHSEPPLYNLGLGLVLKAFPAHPAPAFHALNLALGLTEVLCLFALVKGLGVSVRTAWGAAALVSVSPASILYENMLFYDYPVFVLLTVSALLALRLEQAPSLGRGAALFGVLAILVGTRSLYQPVFLLLAVAVVVGLRVLPVRVTLLAAAPALAVVAALMVHNAVEFGTLSTSSFMGENLERVAVNPAPLELRRRLVAAGELDPIVLVPDFSPVTAYLAYVGSPPPTGVPALDQRTKSTGRPNYNNEVFLRVSSRLTRTSARFAFHHPGWYLRGAKLAAERYFWPPTYAEGIVGSNKYAIRRLEAFFEAFFYGSTPRANRIGFLTVALFAIAFGFGLRILFRKADPHRFAIVFVLFLIAYTSLVAVLGDLGENYRSRLPVDPLVLALVAAAFDRVVRRRCARPASGPQAGSTVPASRSL